MNKLEYVYLASAGKRYKIGYTKYPIVRFTSLKTNSPYKVKMLYVRSFNNAKVLVNMLRARFAKSEKYRGWLELEITELFEISKILQKGGETEETKKLEFPDKKETLYDIWSRIIDK